MTTSPGYLVSFDFEGHTYDVPKAEEWTLEALEAYEDGRVATLVREMLGAEQWAAFKDSPEPRKVGDLNRFFEAAQKALNLGN